MALRPIAPLNLPSVQPGNIPGDAPTFVWVSPTELCVDERYQRNLSERSMRLIGRIVSGWDWKAYKPPIVVRIDGSYHVLDGQHTAIAAATHPGIEAIPVMMVEADSAEERASAFVKHNRDRVAVTPAQLHYSLVAAEDPDAMTIQQLCDKVGIKILRQPPSAGLYHPRDTMAISTIRSLVRSRYPVGARKVLQVVADSQCAPITAAHIKSVELLHFDQEYRDAVDMAAVTLTLRSKTEWLEKESKTFANTHDIPIYRAMAITLFKACKARTRGPTKTDRSA